MTILASWVDAVVDQLELQGFDPRELTRELWGPSIDRIAPTREVALVLARKLWQRAARLTRDPLLGIRVGIGLPMQAMNITGLVIMHSPTLRAALINAEKYQQIVSNSGRICMHRTKNGGAELRYVVTPCPVDMHPMQIDSLFARLLTYLRNCSSRNIDPEVVELPSGAAGERDAYERLLGCRVVLGAPAVRIRYSQAALETPFQGADPALLAMAIAHADSLQRLQSRSDSIASAVRAAIRQAGFDQASCEKVAADIGITVRTLQRRLADAGTPFRRLLETVRMEEALLLLTEGEMPLPEIATHLGYSEPSSFWHAVKSCWGAPPRQLRLNGRDFPLAGNPTSH